MQQPADNVTGDCEYAELADRPSATSKRTRLDSEIDPELLDLARYARVRRDNILRDIAALEQPPIAANKSSDANIPFTNAVVQLSNPALYTQLSFPFVGKILPGRFNIGHEGNGDMWLYMGREKFKELVEGVQNMQRSNQISTLWVYGTKGYGKFHLLASLVLF